MKREHSAKLRSWIDGTNRSVGARAFRLAALPFSLLYSTIIKARNLVYDVGLVKSQQVDRPTIAIGNITMGGVGKTPLVAWTTDYILRSHRKAAIISRGYRAQAQREIIENQKDFLNSLAWIEATRVKDPDCVRFFHFNDEACELALRFPDAPHFLASKRIEAARAVLRLTPETDAIILDDAFQHRQMARDLNIVVLDALDPFGGERVAPAGYLREPISGLKRARVVILNRADLIHEDAREAIRKRVVQVAPHIIWCETAQRPTFIMERVVTSGKVELRREDFSQWLGKLPSRNAVAFCGLGAPLGFKRTLLAAQFNLLSFMPFPDHCVYKRDDFLAINSTVRNLNADVVVTTMKDFVKLTGKEPIEKPVVALGIDVVFLNGESEFKEALDNVLHTNRV